MMTDAIETLVTLSGVEHRFAQPGGKGLQVLSDIHFSLNTGELVAILGPSGCGKSTLIRIVTGLISPTKGEALYRGEPVTGPSPHAALVFQQFALYPWLTVAQNIEQALIPRGISPVERRQRVSEVITLIGLDGFEEAYPRELSGGMKQRVGIARALVVRPELLCMDEPFSQVDALTAETLRSEVVNLWRDREKYPQSILLVSHDIHEVASIASRILIMTANPGRIKTVIENLLPYPRDPQSEAYRALVDRIHGIITGLYMPEEETAATLAAVGQPPIFGGPGTIAPVPLAEIRDIAGLIDAVAARGGKTELFHLASEMDTKFTQILLTVKAAELLGFLQTPQDDLILTNLGREFQTATRKGRRQILRSVLIQLPLIKRLQGMVENSPEQRLNKEVLLEELAIQCPQEDPKRLLRILINWGRFADLWTYQSATSTLGLAGAPRTSAASETNPS